MEQRYALSVRRESRQRAPSDWQTQVEAMTGVVVLGASPSRMQISAPAATISEIKTKLGAFLHVEPLISHSRS